MRSLAACALHRDATRETYDISMVKIQVLRLLESFRAHYSRTKAWPVMIAESSEHDRKTRDQASIKFAERERAFIVIDFPFISHKNCHRVVCREMKPTCHSNVEKVVKTTDVGPRRR